MKHELIKKPTVIAALLVLLSGCGTSVLPEGRIHTQASVKDALVADEYRLRIDFSVRSPKQNQLNGLLATQTDPFVVWAQQSFDQSQLVSESVSMQPIYEYPVNQPRQQAGYEIQQGYLLKGLSQQQYRQALSKLSDFAVRSFSLDSVQASEGARAISEARMMATAYEKNQQQAQALASLAGLCGLQAIDVKPQQHHVPQPRVMMMEAKSMDAPPSEQTMGLNLAVSWAAYPC